jgi:nucleotide-binding universal stress UspA family protein
MARTTAFRVLHPTDGSPSAELALETSVEFPWPARSEAWAIVVRSPQADSWAHSEAAAARVASRASRTLAARWPAPQSVVREGLAADQILWEARSCRADALVMGWRGHGRFRRLLMGSVSRAVLRAAALPVLVVRRTPHRCAHIVVALDGSPAARRAIGFLVRCEPPIGGSVTVVTVLTTPTAPNHPWLSDLSAQVRREVAEEAGKERRRALLSQKAAMAALRKSGWRVLGVVRRGAPLYEVLRVVRAGHAGVLVVGKSRREGAKAAVLGSTAEGAVNESPVPVLVVP